MNIKKYNEMFGFVADPNRVPDNLTKNTFKIMMESKKIITDISIRSLDISRIVLKQHRYLKFLFLQDKDNYIIVYYPYTVGDKVILSSKNFLVKNKISTDNYNSSQMISLKKILDENITKAGMI